MSSTKAPKIPPRLLDRKIFLAVDFTLGPSVSLDRLDGWLAEALELPGEYLGKDAAGGNGTSSLVLDFLSRSLLLARLLLQVGRLPVFDDPGIERIEKTGKKNQYRARVHYPLVLAVPGACYNFTTRLSLEMCEWMSRNPQTDENRQKIYGDIQEKVVKPLHGMIPSGKSTMPVLKVAHSMEIPFVHLGMGAYQLGWGSKARRIDRSATGQDSAIGSRLAQNKVRTAGLLRMCGLPAPVHSVAGNARDALAAAQKIGFPIVVKPLDRDRGEGVVVDIMDEAGLAAGFAETSKLSRSRQVIVERQVPGVCHRLFISNGKLLYAVKRLPMSVRGDGKRTVTQLVEDEVRIQQARPPWSRTEIQPMDDMARAAIASAGLSEDAVPAAGVLVPLRRIESTEWGGVDENVTDIVHPENLSIAIRAAELFEIYNAGIDIITPDISVPWYENGAILNEVNFAPLLGGGEISRSHIPRFLSELIQGDGKIPISIFRGGDKAKSAAMKRRDELVGQGVRCYLTTASHTLDPRGAELKLAITGVENRVRALICNADVDEIVVAA